MQADVEVYVVKPVKKHFCENQTCMCTQTVFCISVFSSVQKLKLNSEVTLYKNNNPDNAMEISYLTSCNDKHHEIC